MSSNRVRVRVRVRKESFRRHDYNNLYQFLECMCKNEVDHCNQQRKDEETDDR